VTFSARAVATLGGVSRVCYYHAGCPDGFGAAYAAWRAWGERGRIVARGHDDPFDALAHEGDLVIFADISLRNAQLRDLGEVAERVVVLDHHWSARQHFESDPQLAIFLAGRGHRVLFDLEHSGAVLAWRHFHPGDPEPELLRYVEDQDLWAWKLPESEAVNAAIGSYPREIEVWDELVRRPWQELAREGAPLLRAMRSEVARALRFAHPVRVGELRLEAVNSLHHRSHIGHALASRAAFGTRAAAVYRSVGSRVDVSLYSIGDCEVSAIAERYGGGGHRNAAGFSVPLAEWLERFV
jgi:oligoribonuclease NrnB/cAMP/cGMP phosphodiesterase (DHH superfamily)